MVDDAEQKRLDRAARFGIPLVEPKEVNGKNKKGKKNKVDKQALSAEEVID